MNKSTMCTLSGSPLVEKHGPHGGKCLQAPLPILPHHLTDKLPTLNPHSLFNLGTTKPSSSWGREELRKLKPSELRHINQTESLPEIGRNHGSERISGTLLSNPNSIIDSRELKQISPHLKIPRMLACKRRLFKTELPEKTIVYCLLVSRSAKIP